MRALRALPLLVLAAALAAGATRAGDPIPEIDVTLEQIPGGVVAGCRSSCGFDELELEVGKDFAKALTPVSLPPGWTLEADGKRARLSGPALPAGQPVRLRLDAGSAPRPQKISYRVRLEGRTLLERKNEPVELVPQHQVMGSLEGVVTLPTQVAPGEPMRMQVSDGAGLSGGGTWSLSGTVVAEEEDAEEDGERRRVALAVPSDRSEEVPADILSDVAVALAAQGAPEGTWEVVPFDGGEDPAVDDAAVELWTVARDTGGGQGRTVSNATKASHDPAMNTIRNLKTAIAEKPAGEDGRGSAYLVRPARESGSAPAQIVIVDAGAGSPPDEDDEVASGGEDAAPTLTIEPVEGAETGDDGALLHYFDLSGTPPTDGATTLFATVSTSRSNLKKTSIADANPDGRVDFLVPEDLRPGDTLALRYVDAFGELLLDVPEVPGVEVVEPGAGDAPRITDASPRAFPGRLACVCGSFPSPEAWDGVLLDGEALGAPGAASSRMVWVQLPAGIAPGEHVFTGAPEPGFPPEDRAATLVLRVAGQIDSSKLQRLETTPMRLWVQGTQEPIELRVRNRTPSVISIEGGDDQVIRTSGGDPNQLERTVRGISVGAFDIQYELAGEPCPCSPSSD